MIMVDNFDILNLNDDVEWSHIQLFHHLWDNGIKCLYCDMYTDDNLAIIVGCNALDNELSRVLGVHKDCIYRFDELGLIVLNLYQEKCLRGECE